MVGINLSRAGYDKQTAPFCNLARTAQRPKLANGKWKVRFGSGDQWYPGGTMDVRWSNTWVPLDKALKAASICVDDDGNELKGPGWATIEVEEGNWNDNFWQLQFLEKPIGLHVEQRSSSHIGIFRASFLIDLLFFASPGWSLRLMNWSQANTDEEQYTSLPVMPDDWIVGRSYSGDNEGVMKGYPGTIERTEVFAAPWEVQIDLANTLQSLTPHTLTLYANLPAGASNQYAAELAELMRDTLNPQVVVAVELGNETWNWGQSATRWVREVLAEPMFPALGPNAAQGAWLATRTVEIKERMKPILGERMKTLVNVQNSNNLHDVMTAPGGVDTNQIDIAAIAPYFNKKGLTEDGEAYEVKLGGSSSPDLQLKKGRLLSFLPDSLRRAKDEMSQAMAACENYGLDLWAYESGQHFTSPDNRQAEIDFICGAKDAMAPFWEQHLRDWFEVTGNWRITLFRGPAAPCADGSIFSMWEYDGSGSAVLDAIKPVIGELNQEPPAPAPIVIDVTPAMFPILQDWYGEENINELSGNGTIPLELEVRRK